MTAKNWTTKEIADDVIRRQSAGEATNIVREEVIRDMNYAYQEIVSLGDETGQQGFYWLLVSEEQSFVGDPLGVPAVILTNPFIINLTVPMRRLLVVRLEDSTHNPRTLHAIPPHEYFRYLRDHDEEAGFPQRYYLGEYDQVNDTYELFVHPAPISTSAITIVLTFLYQASSQDLESADTNFFADNVRIPAHLREILVWGTLKRRFFDDDRMDKLAYAEQQFTKWAEKLKVHEAASRENPERIYSDSELQVWGGQTDPRFEASRRFFQF